MFSYIFIKSSSFQGDTYGLKNGDDHQALLIYKHYNIYSSVPYEWPGHHYNGS